MDMTIATWFVADTAQNATHFPQVGGDSSSLKFQKVYWRCIVAFFATSLIQNAGAKHQFYSNCPLPAFDDFDVRAFFARHRIDTVSLDITYRLPRNVASAWGNQFYILDVIKHFAANPTSAKLVVLDSDCIWNGNAQGLDASIDQHGCITYTLDESAYLPSQPINGVTRAAMKSALLAWDPTLASATPEFGLHYHGGEIFAATTAECQRLASQIDSLWNWQIRNTEQKGFLEEAHFLSILYALNGYKPFTANPFIKRMWTTFKHRNVVQADVELPIWHLPAEKRSGFKVLFEEAKSNKLPTDRVELAQRLSRTMGIPTRSPNKFARDLSLKVLEKAVAIVGLR